MNTKIIMTASAITLGAAGIALTFASEEIARLAMIGQSVPLRLAGQVLGALYLAFAMMNWMTRESVIGGIYNRPIIVANTMHFSVAGLALIKGLFSTTDAPLFIWAGTGLYMLFAISFGMMLFRNPVNRTKE